MTVVPNFCLFTIFVLLVFYFVHPNAAGGGSQKTSPLKRLHSAIGTDEMRNKGMTLCIDKNGDDLRLLLVNGGPKEDFKSPPYYVIPGGKVNNEEANCEKKCTKEASNSSTISENDETKKPIAITKAALESATIRELGEETSYTGKETDLIKVCVFPAECKKKENGKEGKNIHVFILTGCTKMEKEKLIEKKIKLDENKEPIWFVALEAVKKIKPSQLPMLHVAVEKAFEVLNIQEEDQTPIRQAIQKRIRREYPNEKPRNT